MKLTEEQIDKIELSGHRFVDSEDLKTLANAINVLNGGNGEYLTPDTLYAQLHLKVNEIAYDLKQTDELDNTKRYSFDKYISGCNLVYQLINPIITPEVVELKDLDEIIQKSRWYLDIGGREKNIQSIFEDRKMYGIHR